MLSKATVAALALLLAATASGRTVFEDAAKRLVTIPDRVERVYAAGPPAAVVIYTLAPEKLLGWTRKPSPEEEAYLPEAHRNLPELGRLTGRGNTVNLEVVVAADPDLVVDLGSVGPTYASLADRVQEQTGVPSILLGGRLDELPEAYRKLGPILGVPERGEQLAATIETMLDDVARRIAPLGPQQRPRIYYARGPEGLDTALTGSINVEAIDFVRAVNVAGEAIGTGGLSSVSLEQVLAWDPEVIVTVDPAFYAAVFDDPRWRGVRAVRQRRVYLAPQFPFPWVDFPPSVNRVLGVRWLAAVLYPDRFPEPIEPIVRDFYARFYHRDLTDAELARLLEPAGGGWTPNAEGRRHNGRASLRGLTAGFACLLVAALFAFSIGAYPVTPADLIAWLGMGAHELDPSAALVIGEIRGPRVATAMIIGAALSAAGASYQALFRNPLVAPDILGVSSGAAFGAVLGIYLSMPVVAIQGLALLGGLAAVAVVYVVAARIRSHDPVLVMVLMGIVIGALLGSGVSLIKLLADPYDQLPAITFWLLGSLSATNRADLLSVLPAFLIGIMPLAVMHWRMNVMTLGEEEARALGVDTRRVRLAAIAGATLMTAAAVSVSGIVGWVGLVIPHVARLLVGPSFGRLMATSTLLGAAFLLLVDTLARTIGPTEVPLGVLTATIGAPVFVWLLATSRRQWR